jgi:hypothetical protein
VTLTVHPEATGDTAPPVRTIVGSFLAGPGALSWNGKKDNGTTVQDDAYIYVVTATAASGRIDKFSPQFRHLAGSHGDIDPDFNPYTNDPSTSVHYMIGGNAVRASMQITPAGGAMFLNPLMTNEPVEEWDEMDVEWDGRYPESQGATIVPGTSELFFGVPTTLLDNYIIARGDRPKVNSPVSSPYRIFEAYGGVSALQFTLERDAIVTVTVCPPNAAMPATCGGLRLVDAQPMTAGPHEVIFDPIDPADPNAAKLRFSGEGAFTAVVEALNPQTGTRSVRRIVINVHP